MNVRDDITALCDAWRRAERCRLDVEALVRLAEDEDRISLAVVRLASATAEVDRLERMCGVRK